MPGGLCCLCAYTMTGSWRVVAFWSSRVVAFWLFFVVVFWSIHAVVFWFVAGSETVQP